MSAHVMHHDSPAKVGRRERLGVRLIIVADGAFVFGLIFTYFYLRNLNLNGGWVPAELGPDGGSGHTYSIGSGWLVVIPLIVTALLHRFGTKSGRAHTGIAWIGVFSLAIGWYLQWKQLSTMTVMLPEGGGFEGAYASTWFLMGAANWLHYLLGIFVALGIALRSRRTNLDPILEKWRQETAGSWLSWIAISGVAVAITTSFV